MSGGEEISLSQTDDREWTWNVKYWNTVMEAGEIIQWIKNLLFKCEETSSDPWNACKFQTSIAATYNLSTGKVKMGRLPKHTVN